MNVRVPAIVLVLSLVSPAVATAVCELTCLEAHHHATAAAMEADCHRHDAASAPVVAVSAVDAAFCHRDSLPASAIVKASPQLASVPASMVRPRPAGLQLPVGTSFHRRVAAPPGLLLTATQLRI
jgi:hypothetical protein